MNFLIHYGFGAVSLPRDAILKLLAEAEAGELKILLLLAADPSLRMETETKFEEIATRCALRTDEVAEGVRRLAERGVLVPAKEPETAESERKLIPLSEPEKPAATQHPKKERFPSYTDAEVARLFGMHGDLRPMIDLAQTLLGKVFSQHETASLVALYDYYGLDCHYILSLLAYLAKKNKANMRYIEATAAGLVQDGIVSVAALEARFATLDRTDSNENTVRRLFGFGERALTTKEKKYVRDWTEWEISPELLTYAYEETVSHTARPGLGYMNKILQRLHAAGVHDRAGAEAHRATFQASGGAGAKHSFESGDFLDAALARSYGDDGQGKEPEKLNND